MWVSKEGDTQLTSNSGVIGLRMGEYCMSLANKCLKQKLIVVVEANNSNFEFLGAVKPGGDFGLVVKRLSGIEGLDFEGTVVERKSAVLGGRGQSLG